MPSYDWCLFYVENGSTLPNFLAPATQPQIFNFFFVFLSQKPTKSYENFLFYTKLWIISYWMVISMCISLYPHKIGRNRHGHIQNEVLLLIAIMLSVCCFYTALADESLNSNSTAHPRFFETLNDRTYELFSRDKSAILSYNPASKFICLSPSAKFYGGFGNLLLSILGVVGFALPLNRVSIINHPLFNLMFDHPDSTRQSWTLLSPLKLSEGKGGESSVSPPIAGGKCIAIEAITLDQFPRKYGVNGCTQSYFINPHSKKYYESIFPTINKPFKGFDTWEQVESNLANWMFSNPKKVWVDLVRNYSEKSIFRGDSRCSMDNIDFATQFRTWRDVRPQNMKFSEAGGDCHMHCLITRIKENIRVRSSSPLFNSSLQHNDSSFCVFVTSDNVTSSHILVDRIKALSTDTLDIRAFAHEDEDEHWHTIDLTSGSLRYEIPAGEEDSILASHSELFDWYIMGQAQAVVYTEGSTFGFTSRLRRPLEQRLQDFTTKQEGRGKCECKPTFKSMRF